jgi:NADPH-dependent F420 reductase
MRIAILGGTGDLGRGLTLRWCAQHDVVVGSRVEEKAKALAEEYRRIASAHYGSSMAGSITGLENSKAIESAALVIFSVPPESAIEFARNVRSSVTMDKIIVSPVVSMQRRGKVFNYEASVMSSQIHSMAETLAETLETRNLIAAFHTLPAKKLSNLAVELTYDVLMASDNLDSVKILSELVRSTSNLKPIYAGPLSVAHMLESLTPLMLNLSIHSGLKDASIRIV